MKIVWEIEETDTQRIRDFVESCSGDRFVQTRKARNLSRPRTPPTDEEFWGALIMALLTTQQRSGPQSSVNRFLRVEPFPLSLENCRQHTSDLESWAHSVLTDFGGIRRTNVIPKEMNQNLDQLERQGMWKELRLYLDQLAERSDPGLERIAANWLADHLRGIGPKQSRNLLQVLGLTIYEIPIDSRITKWLNRNGFPVHLSAGMLSDRHYYEFVSDGIQELCEARPIRK